MLTVSKLLEALDGLDHHAKVIVGIINGPTFNALDAFPEVVGNTMILYILCDEEPRTWEGPKPTLREDGTATLEFDPENPAPEGDEPGKGA